MPPGVISIAPPPYSCTRERTLNGASSKFFGVLPGFSGICCFAPVRSGSFRSNKLCHLRLQYRRDGRCRQTTFLRISVNAIHRRLYFFSFYREQLFLFECRNSVLCKCRKHQPPADFRTFFQQFIPMFGAFPCDGF